MNNEVLEDISQYAIKKLKEHYGYCGLAAGDDMVMINSDDKNGRDIKITITIEDE